MSSLKSSKIGYFALASLFLLYGILAIAIPIILEQPFNISAKWWQILSPKYWTSYYYIFMSGIVSLGIFFLAILINTLNFMSVYKHCSLCNSRYFGIFEKASEIPKLANLNEYSGPIHDTLCPKCWNKLIQRECSFCGKPLNLFKSQKDNLISNYEAHSIKSIAAIKYVCPSCYKLNILTNCDKCGNAYPKVSNKKSQYYKNKEIFKFLYPYHANWSPNWKSLCQSCYNSCCASVEEVKNQMNNWVFGTKKDYIDYYRIDENLGWVEVCIEGNPQKSPILNIPLLFDWLVGKRYSKVCVNTDQVEEKLKLYTIQKGGNAYINCSLTSRTVKQIKNSYKDQYKSKPVLQKEVLSIKTYYGGNALAVKVLKSLKQNVSIPSHSCISSEDIQDELYIIDGSNICRYNSEHNENGKVILSHILSLCNLLSESNIKYRCYFDASARYNIPEDQKETYLPIYNSMLKEFNEIFFEVPGKSDADAFILQDASHNNACIITNDNYREYHDQHSWLQSADRLIKFMINNDTIIIPDLNIYSELILDSSIAFDILRSSLNITQNNLSFAK